MREYITTANIDEMITILAEEKKQAREILKQCIDEIEDEWERVRFLSTMDDMNIRGIQIVEAFEKYFLKSVEKMIEAVLDRQINLIGYLNTNVDIGEEVVHDGAPREGKLFMPSNTERLVRLVNTKGEVIYEMESGSTITVSQGSKKRESCVEYLDPQYIKVDSNIYHIVEFARIMEKKGYSYYPGTSKKRTSEIGMYYPGKKQRRKH